MLVLYTLTWRRGPEDGLFVALLLEGTKSREFAQSFQKFRGHHIAGLIGLIFEHDIKTKSRTK